jgi:hypothetical protein
MQDPVGDMIVGHKGKDLGFVDISAVSPGVENSVGIQSKLLPVCFRFFRVSSYSFWRYSGSRRKALQFIVIESDKFY